MTPFRRTPAVWLVVLAWLGVHAAALLLAGRASDPAAPWWAWGLVPDELLRRLGADVPALVRLGEGRRVLTYAFLHGMVLNLALGIWILLGTGRRLESAVGTARFWIVFVLGVAGGGIAHALLGSGLLVGGWFAIVGILGALLVWSFLSPDPAARASRGSTLLFLLIVVALSLAFGGSLVADVGSLVGGALAMVLLGPRRILPPAGLVPRVAAGGLLVLVLAAGGLQAFDTQEVDAGEVERFLQDLAEAERGGRAILRAPHKATPRMMNDLATRLAALRNPACLADDAEARRALDAYLDVWLRTARGDMPDPFAFQASLEAAQTAWREHENALRARTGVGRSWSRSSPDAPSPTVAGRRG